MFVRLLMTDGAFAGFLSVNSIIEIWLFRVNSCSVVSGIISWLSSCWFALVMPVMVSWVVLLFTVRVMLSFLFKPAMVARIVPAFAWFGFWLADPLMYACLFCR